eukprot:735872-Pleurochrysis_carterae.AAC.1
MARSSSSALALRAIAAPVVEGRVTMPAQVSSVPWNSKITGKTLAKFFEIWHKRSPKAERYDGLKVGAAEPPLRELFKCERNPFGASDGGYKRDMSGRMSSFLGVDMGCPDLNSDSLVHPERLSLNIIPLRPPREILTVPAVNVTHYWPDSVCGWEPHIKRHDMIGSVLMALIMISLALLIHWLRICRLS